MSPHEESLYIEDWRKVARQEDVSQALPVVRELIGLLFPDEVLES